MSELHEDGWEVQPPPPRRLHPGLAVAAVVVVVLLAVLVRPGTPEPEPDPDPLPVTPATATPTPPATPQEEPTVLAAGAPRWRPIAPAPFAPDEESRGVWAGDRLWVWDHSDTGRMWAYDPVADTWEPGPPAPDGRAAADFALVWTGQELLVWGGTDLQGRVTAGGMAYDPAALSWRVLPDAPLTPRADPGAAWSPAHGGMVVAGGDTGGGSATRLVGDAALYEPGRDAWTALPALGLSARSGPAVLPQPDGVIVFGGHEGPALPLDGAVLTVAGAVTPIPPLQTAFDVDIATVALPAGLALWGRPSNLADPPGASWTPEEGWAALPRLLRQERADPAAVLVPGDRLRMVVWDGLERTGPDRRADGFVLDLDEGGWGQLPTAPLSARRDAVVVWTGDALLVWGGFSGGLAPTDGALLPLGG